MRIILDSLSLTNFKGIKSLTLKFNQETFIKGDNATGKTTINDAFRWLLFGKDSEDRSDFNIKTLNPDNTPIHNLDHEVTGTLIVDGSPVTFKRTFREKWVKPKGTNTTVMQGHETVYSYNDVPMSMKEYQSKVDAICPEANFKLLTDPLFFPNLNWTKQREILFHLAGTLTDDEIALINPAFAALMETIRTKNVTLLEYKKEVSTKRLKIKEQLEAIPTRIDELHRIMPAVQDWSMLTKEIEEFEGAIKAIDENISNTAKGVEKSFENYTRLQNERNAKITRINEIKFDIKSQLAAIENDSRLRLSAFRTDINNKTASKNRLIAENTTLSGQLEIKKQQRETLLNTWRAMNNETLVINDDQLSCPTCKRMFEGESLESLSSTLQANFHLDKTKRISENMEKGKAITSEIKDIEKRIDANLEEIKIQEGEIFTISEMEKEPIAETPSLESLLNHNEEYKRLSVDIASEVEPIAPVIDTKEQDAIKADYRSSIDAHKALLNNREVISRTNVRIEELKEQQKNLAQEQADLENIEFTIQNFDKARVDAIEEKINSMFKVVRFKMFDQQINGGENPTCVCTVNGVPFPDLNNAMKINAGMDIISTLSRAYNVFAPVFIDNRESVNTLAESQSQIINLVVTKDKSLKVA